MKELCQCNCAGSLAERYRTPWCSILAATCPCAPVDLLHFWYKLPMLQDEIDKRSSYLGKFRRTEEAQHLLDLIRMSKDEHNLFIPFAKAAQADVYDALVTHMPRVQKTYFFREGKDTIVFNNHPLPYPPVSFKKDDYVEFNGDLYMAVEDGSSADYDGKLVPTEDYRDSIHFGLVWKCCSNLNAVEPLDVAIFEALVARIIFKWLSYAYPEEAPRYDAEYQEHLQKIRSRANLLDNNHIVSRIPRMF